MDVNIRTKIETNAVVIKNLTAEQKAIEDQIRELTARKNALANKVETLRENITGYLEGALYESDFCKISYGSSKSLVVDDLSGIPEKYLEAVAPKPDKKAIKKAIESGEAISGAHIETSSFLKIAFK